MTRDRRARTVGELKAGGYRPETVKQEIRRNLVAKLRQGQPLFPGVLGYERTVIPGIVNALLATCSQCSMVICRQTFLISGIA